MDNLKILPQVSSGEKHINMKLIHINEGNGIAIKLDDSLEYWLLRLENDSDGSVNIKLWRGDVGSYYKLTRKRDECGGDAIVYKLERSR